MEQTEQAPENQTGNYHKQYYQRNAEAIKQKRRERYRVQKLARLCQQNEVLNKRIEELKEEAQVKQ